MKYELEIIFINAQYGNESIEMYLENALDRNFSLHIENRNIDISGMDESRDSIGLSMYYYLHIVLNGSEQVGKNQIRVLVTSHPIDSLLRINSTLYRNTILIAARELHNAEASEEALKRAMDQAISSVLLASVKKHFNSELRKIKHHSNCLMSKGQYEAHNYSVCDRCLSEMEFGGVDFLTQIGRIQSNDNALHNGTHIILVHGINSNGSWISKVRPILSKAGFEVSKRGYRFMRTRDLIFRNTSQLILRRGIDRKVSKFFLHYKRKNKNNVNKISVIAHSNGSLIVAEALKYFPEIQLDQIILVGSIVPTDFDWDEFIERGQVNRVLSEGGDNDIWPIIAESFITGAGSSGVNPFTCESESVVFKRYKDEDHSSMLTAKHCRKYWLPFLSGGDPVKNSSNRKIPKAKNAARWEKVMRFKFISD